MSATIDQVLTDCRVLVQGITGREASMVVGHILRYGTKVVAGTSPGKGGQMISGIPVYDSVEEALIEHKCNATIVYVPPAFVRDAVLEAIDSAVSVIVVVTERVPQKDVMEVLCKASQKGSRIIGPNTTGMISPSRRIKLGPIGGSLPERTFAPGTVAVVSRSGGMTSEIAWTLKRAGFGISLGVSIGGDPIVGTKMKEMLEILEQDDDTQAVILFCEPGGFMELEVAETVSLGYFTKPVVAYVAGKFTERFPRGVKFGHAGSIIQGEIGTPSSKILALKDSGIVVVDRLSEIPSRLRQFLG